jgi:hypothetical protein
VISRNVGEERHDFAQMPGVKTIGSAASPQTPVTYYGYGVAVRLIVFIVLSGLGPRWPAAAQGLPPGALLLARVKAHMRQELARLPNCSCLETVRRDYQPAGGKLRPLDTVRLEVLYSDRRELYASPGDRRFGDNQPIDFAGSGTLGNGYFALFLSEVASEHGPSYEYKGEELRGGRLLARWDYRVPVSMSGNTITSSGVSGTVGTKGAFWADPATYDIVRIAQEADEIPPALPVRSSETSIDYAHTNLSGTDFLLPQSADSRLVKFSGEDSRNHIEFTHCHLYGAESSISFGAPAGFPLFGASSVLEMKRELLPALPIVIKITTRITDKTAVGALIEGVVEGNVLHKRTVLIPAGSPVRGRVRRLEWNEEKGGYYVVALEFTDLEAGGTRYRFFADLVGMDSLPGLRQTIRTSKRETRALGDGGSSTLVSDEILSLPDLPGVGSFFVQARRLDLPPGFRMTWKTRALAP